MDKDFVIKRLFLSEALNSVTRIQGFVFSRRGNRLRPQTNKNTTKTPIFLFFTKTGRFVREYASGVAFFTRGARSDTICEQSAKSLFFV